MTPNKVNDPVTLTLTFVLNIDFPDFLATVCILLYFTSCSHIYRRICQTKIKITKVRLGYCFSPYQRLWLYNGAPLVAFYDTLGIRRTYSRLKPPASSRGKISKEQRIKEHKEKKHNAYLEMRRKLKEDSRAYKEFKKKDAIRAKKYRKHLSQEKRKQLADKSKLRMYAIASAIGRNGQSRRGRKAVAAYV